MLTQIEHLCSEGDWLKFYWGLWAGTAASRFEVSDIINVWKSVSDDTKYSVTSYCVSRDPSPGGINGEAGWTCKDFPWVYTGLKPGTTTPQFEIIPSTPHRRGKSWKDVNSKLSSTTLTESQRQRFRATGVTAGVIYTY